MPKDKLNKERVRVPVNETKSDRFIRIANKRVSRCLKNLKQIANLASSNYEYTTEDIQTIATALSEGLKACISRFSEKAGMGTEFDVTKRNTE